MLKSDAPRLQPHNIGLLLQGSPLSPITQLTPIVEALGMALEKTRWVFLAPHRGVVVLWARSFASWCSAEATRTEAHHAFIPLGTHVHTHHMPVCASATNNPLF